MATSSLSSRTALDGCGRWAPVGFQYPARTITHTRQWQSTRLQAADVDPARYGDVAEVGLFGLDCFDSMVDAGLCIDGYIFFDQRFQLLKPVMLDQPVTIRGEVCALIPVSRGLFVDETYRFYDESGTLCLETRLRGVLNLAPGQQEGLVPEPMPRRKTQPVEGWELLETKQITPRKVRDFSEDIGNDLHFDPQAAQAMGFRAPLAQGVMSSVYLMGGLARRSCPTQMDVTVEYLRPIFWDSTVQLWGLSQCGTTYPAALQSRDEAGKVTVQLSARSVSSD
jgi:hypothetical protein